MQSQFGQKHVKPNVFPGYGVRYGAAWYGTAPHQSWMPARILNNRACCLPGQTGRFYCRGRNSGSIALIGGTPGLSDTEELDWAVFIAEDSAACIVLD